MARKKGKTWLPVVVTFVAIAFVAAAFFYVRNLNFITGAKTKFKDFGIYIPQQYSIHGIDVSRYQKGISWDMVSIMEDEGVKIGFAFLKATEGISIYDPRHYYNYKNAKMHGLTCGAYHYFKPNIDGKLQADFFYNNVNLEAGDLPPVLDVEETGSVSNKVFIARVGEWLKVTEKNFGVKPIIYTNAHMYNKYFLGKFDDYPLWIAHYQTNTPAVMRKWDFWQHSETGRVNGINAKVDFNVFSGDSSEFRNLLIK
ncbi:MAG: glycoside hydrolase family 25 protein [Bacteroidetes bacterium]|nr:glycoside hydrolase family 25 protein [Bacteroidota bacterium]